MMINKLGIYQLEILLMLYNHIYSTTNNNNNNKQYDTDSIYKCYQHIIATCFINYTNHHK